MLILPFIQSTIGLLFFSLGFQKECDRALSDTSDCFAETESVFVISCVFFFTNMLSQKLIDCLHFFFYFSEISRIIIVLCGLPGKLK